MIYALIAALGLVAVLGAIAYFRRTYPHRRLIYLALAPGLVSIAIVLGDQLLPALIVLDALVLGVAVFDFFTLPHRKTFSVERQTGRVVSLGKEHQVTLVVTNHSRKHYLVWIRDGVPGELTADPEDFLVQLGPLARTVEKYQLLASRRGSFTLPSVFLRIRSRWGLWNRQLTLPQATVIHVYPDMKQLSEYAVLARTNRLSLVGVRRTRKIGQDNEFERLRDYAVDDNFKHIDWRSTARRHKLTVKDFQANQSQRLIFMLDCGRMMNNQAAGLSLLDHSLNAMLMLSYVALKQGDSVGLLCFSDEINAFVPPGGGMNQMNRLLHASFDRFPRLVESRYDQAFLYLAGRCRKRSLVILVTNLIDEVNALQVEQYLSSLVGRHLPLGVLLRDHQLFDAVEPAESLAANTVPATNLFRAAAAAEILAWRQQVLADLQSHGVMAVDVFPENLTAPLVNRYLDIKARHLL